MGSTLSAAALGGLAAASPQPRKAQVQLPLSLHGPCRTTVWELGTLSGAGSGGGTTTPLGEQKDASANLCSRSPGAASAADHLCWHTIGSCHAFPLPPGYRASCTAFGQQCILTIENDTRTSSGGCAGRRHNHGHGTPLFVLRTAGGEVFAGATPTAPLAKLALHLGQPQVVNGMEAFGLLAPPVQQALQAAALAAGLVPGAPVLQAGQLAADPPTQQAQQVAAPSIQLPSHHLQLSPLAADGGVAVVVQAAAVLPPAPHHLRLEAHFSSQRPLRSPFAGASAAPAAPETASPLLAGGFWQQQARQGAPGYPLLSRGPRAHAKTPTAATADFASPFATAAAAAAAAPANRVAAGTDGGVVHGAPKSMRRTRRPRRPQLREEGTDEEAEGEEAEGQDVAEAHAKEDVVGGLDGDVADLLRRSSLHRAASTGSARKRDGGCRAWTAYTVYGCKHREAVRAANTGQSASEVEKLLGQRWARLPQEEKQRYQDLAQRVRQAHCSGSGGGGRSARASRPADLGRSPSDAGTPAASAFEDRPQRSVRPSRFFAGLFDTSRLDEEGTPMGASSGSEEEDSGSEGAIQRSPPGSRLPSSDSFKRRRSQEAGGGGGSEGGGASKRKASRPRAAALSEVPAGFHESGVLGLLAQMGCSDAMAAEVLAMPLRAGRT